MGKKLCGVLLALVMALSLLPTLAAADTGEKPWNTESGWIALNSTSIVNYKKDTLFDESRGVYLLSGGRYYLTGDVTLDKPLVVTGASGTSAEITLDLNGHVLQMTGSGSVIEVQPVKVEDVENTGKYDPSPTHFLLQDSDPTGTTHYFAKDGTGLWHLCTAANCDHSNCKTVKGGVITGGTGTSYNGVNYGGGIYIAGSNEVNSVTMTGGSIVGCTANEGGGVYVIGGTKEIDGAKRITSFTMSGSAQIRGCTAASRSGSYGTGGGIHNLGKLTLQDSVMIADCAATDQDSTAIYNVGSGGDTGTICANGGEVHGTVYSTGSSSQNGLITSSSSGGTVTRFYGDVTNGASVIENGEFYETVTNVLYHDNSDPEDRKTGYGQITGGTFYRPIKSDDSSFKSYTVTLDPNGGEIERNTLYVVSGSKLTLPAAPTRDGYTFVGWFTEKTGGTEVTTGTTFKENTTVYAHWSSSTTTHYYYNTTTADKIEAPRTFDAGIAMYGVMVVMSVTGMAYVGKKRF